MKAPGEMALLRRSFEREDWRWHAREALLAALPHGSRRSAMKARRWSAVNAARTRGCGQDGDGGVV
jgi:hypothetical protein